MTQTPIDDADASHLLGGLSLALAVAVPLAGILIISLTLDGDSATQQNGLVGAVVLCSALALTAVVLAVKALLSNRGRLMAGLAVVLVVLTNPYSLLLLF